MLEIGGLRMIKYKFANDDEQELTKDMLLAQGIITLGNVSGKDKYTRMKTFLAKVLVELQENLKEGQFCEIEFRKRLDFTDTFAIAYKGDIEGPVFLNEFKNAFNVY